MCLLKKQIKQIDHMKKISVAINLGLLAGLVGLLAACQTGEAENKTATPGAAAAPGLPVDVQVVEAGEYRQDEALVGTLMPNRQVDITPEVAKKIVSVAFRDGVHVQQGQLLYQLDNDDVKAQLRKSTAALQLARLNEKRLGELLKTQAVKQQEYDEALTALQSLEAEADLLRVALSKTQIRAPFAGRAGISKVYAGAFVTPGTVLTTLQDVGQVKLRFAVPEKYLALVREGNKVSFTTELSDQPFTAVIRATEPGIDAQSRSLVVEALAGNPGGQLRAGLSARVSFPTRAAGTKAITIPTEALIPAAGGYSVFVVRAGVAKAQAVKVQNRTEDDALITEGLQPGDTLMISNTLRVMEGTPVQVVKVVGKNSNALSKQL